MTLPNPWFPAADEAERLDALHSYNILDTESDPVFNDLALLAAFVCGTPMSLVTLLDEDRQWSKAMVGLDLNVLPREQAFCDTAVRAVGASGVFEVPDTVNDARFANNALVTGSPHIRFYAGVPLLTPEGYPLGTLCALDTVPRALSTDQREAMRLLARQVMTHLELRRTRLLLDDERQKLEGVIRLAGRTHGLVPANTRPDIFVKQDQRLLRVPTSDLLYVEALGDYVNLHLARERLTVYGTMKDLETKLPSSEFARIHRKYIVRLDRIVAIEGDTVSLDGGPATGPGRLPLRVSIGSSYKAGLLARLTVI
ncbi:hypothetical protein GCM10022409_21770 [Hymenobacter glaciei]|uniref:HTH LytTR-type domain-containing protein n=1 Tax=Hymenobacter glaciei TaxID=877209 RepID=A0ABP7U5X7_9BACT